MRVATASQNTRFVKSAGPDLQHNQAPWHRLINVPGGELSKDMMEAAAPAEYKALINLAFATDGQNAQLRGHWAIQNVVAALIRRAGLTGSDITAHSLRHTFALAWLRRHPGQLVELSQLLGHESLDTTAVYTRASAADLARGVEQTPFNLDG